MIRNAVLLTCCLLLGCQPTTKPATSAGRAQTSGRSVTVSDAGKVPAADVPNRTAGYNEGDVVVRLDVYLINLPQGAVSDNAMFWKRIDEDRVDVTVHDLMLRNGVRFGVGPVAEWSTFFKPTLDSLGAVSQTGSFNPARSGVEELPMKSGIEFQDLIYLTEAGPRGRTFQHCEDLFTVAYESIPNRSTDTRLRLCAVVRDLRYGFSVTEANQQVEVERKRAEALYDLKLEAEIPDGQFLVIAPSEQAKMKTSLGANFLLKPGNAGQAETVIVLVPVPGRLAKTPGLKAQPRSQRNP